MTASRAESSLTNKRLQEAWSPDLPEEDEMEVCRHCGGEIEHDDEMEAWVHVESDGSVCGLPVNPTGDDDRFYAEPSTPH